MLQPEEIKNITFEQSVFSGYKKEDVDEFLDKVYSEYSRIYSENAELVEKLKVCITKIEEYRQDEKFLKSAIVNAQKLNETAVQEIELKKKETEEIARKQAEEIIAQANAEADKLLTDCNQKIAEVREKSTYEFVRQQNENARSHSERMREYDAQILAKKAELDNLQKEIDNFKSFVLSVCDKQIALLNTLPEVEKHEAAVPVFEQPVVAPKTLEEQAVNETVSETAVENQVEQVAVAEPKDVPAVNQEIAEEIIEEVVVAEQPVIEDESETETDEEQISIDEVIAKASPVEPSSPVITAIADEPEEEDEAEEPFRLFGASPLVFPQDIGDENDEVVHTAPSPRGRKKLKFGVDFDVKKDK